MKTARKRPDDRHQAHAETPQALELEAEPREDAHANAPTDLARVRIEPNGREFLVIINGSAFLALSRAQAESIARRTCDGRVPSSKTPRETGD